MLYDVSDPMFRCFRVTGLGLIFSFLRFKDGKTRKKNRLMSRVVAFELSVHCCDPLVASFCRLWSCDVFCISILPSLLPISCESLHYMQITTPASVYMVVLRSSTDTWARSMVRSDRLAPGEQILEFSPPPGSLAVRKIKCHAHDSRCQNRNYLETLLWNTSNTSGWSWLMNARTSSLKSVFEKPFYYPFWLILYIIFSQILFQCFINRKDCKYK